MRGPVIALREAALDDVASMHALRLAVRENRSSDPAALTPASYEAYLRDPGCAWVAIQDGCVVGFAILDPGPASI